VRGSPIRTPSDQRSVGSSPRHIAASHVLHRLLVPRHPPCALNILTTHNPPPHGHRPCRRRDTYKQTLCRHTLCRHTLCKTEIKRCSRPLCSSQRPTRAPSTRPHQHREHSAGLRPGRPGQRQQPLRRGLAPTTGGPAPSGPNSVPTTDPPLPPRSPRHHEDDAVLGAAAAAGRTGQRSTLEHHPEHSVIHR
jgi:hypothetical protein